MMYLNSNTLNNATCSFCSDYLGQDYKVSQYAFNSQYDFCNRCWRLYYSNSYDSEYNFKTYCLEVKRKQEADYLQERIKERKLRRQLAKYKVVDPSQQKRRCLICHQVVSKFEPCCDESDLFRDLDNTLA